MRSNKPAITTFIIAVVITLCFFGSARSVFAPTVEQEGFRFREDNGSQTTASWLAQAQDPVILDPTIEINVLNVHSNPIQGDDWVVEFTTRGTADLRIIPDDQATIDDDEFVSLSCDGEERIPQILANDVIYYPDWQCDGTAQVVHYTAKAGDHILRFEFGDQVAYAYNTIAVNGISKGIKDTNHSGTYTFNHIATVNTGLLVVTVQIYDQSSSDGVVSGVTYDGVALTKGTLFYQTTSDGHVSIWYLKYPTTGSSLQVAVSHPGAVTDILASAVNVVGDDGYIEDSKATSVSGQDSPTISWTSVGTDLILFDSMLSEQTNSPEITPDDDPLQNEIDKQDVGDTVGSSYKIVSSGTSQNMNWIDIDPGNDWVIVAMAFSENALATVDLNYPNDTATISDSTPTFEFTGTDGDGEDIEYQFQLATDDVFGTGEFVDLDVTARGYTSIAVDSSNQNVYVACPSCQEIYKQTGGTGSWDALSAGALAWEGVAVDSSNQNVYATVTGTDIYKQTGGSGSFDVLTAGALGWFNIAVDSSNQNVYATVWGGDVYKASGGSDSFSSLSLGTKNWTGITVDSSNQNVYVAVNLASIWKDTGGTDSFSDLTQTPLSWRGLAVNSSNQDVWAGVYLTNHGVYKQTAGSGDFEEYFITGNGWWGTAVDSSTGNVYAVDYLASNIYKMEPGSRLLNKFSVTPDATFTNTTDGGDTHPFDQGDKADYTVQAGDALADDIYYWRVRAKDPDPGLDVWGPWSGTRSFTLDTGGGPSIHEHKITDAVIRDAVIR